MTGSSRGGGGVVYDGMGCRVGESGAESRIFGYGNIYDADGEDDTYFI